MEDTEQLSSIGGALASADAEERRQATSRLSQIDLARALPLLERALGDEDWRVRKEATIAARSFDPAPRLISTMIQLLSAGDNVGQRNAAVDVLSGAGAAATPMLTEALRWLDADGRKLAVETLGRSRDAAAVEPLSAMLDDADDNVRQAAIEAIAQLGPIARDRVSRILLLCLDDRDRLVRLAALEGLRDLEVSIPWERLAPLLSDPMLRSVALSAAALSASKEAAPALARALSEARSSAFLQALAALARLAEGPLADHVAAALRAEGDALGGRLVKLSADPGEPSERRAMALRLAAVARVPGVVDAAFAALSEELLAEGARRALRAVGASALPEMIERLGASEAPAVARAELALVIAEIVEGKPASPESTPPSRVPAPPELLPALRAAARDPDRGVAASALNALSRLGEEDDIDLAAAETRSSVRAVALAAEGALAAIAIRWPRSARARVAEIAGQEGYFLASAIVIGALATIGASREGDAALLARVATTGEPRARRAAVLAVSEIGGPVAMEILSVALTDEEHDVQLAAARSLGRLAAVSADPKPSEILDLVERSGASDLVAATVRAIGEGMSVTYTERRSFPPAPPVPELVEALAEFARSGHSPVAIAAVDALGQAFTAGSRAASEALVAALEHPDLPVAKAAAFKLAESQIGRETLGRALDHPAGSVRARAAEMLADADMRAGRERTSRYPSSSRGGRGDAAAPSSRSTPSPSSRGGRPPPGQRGR